MPEETKIPALDKILIVDDIPENLQMLSALVKASGYSPRPVLSGAEALETALRNPPDLILLDINMPDIDGYEVCRFLKDEPLLRDIPVMFVSAYNQPLDKVKAFKVGGVDYINKPFQFEEVQARIRTHLELRRQKLRAEEDYKQLRQLETLRDSLVHMLVHDLRTPLAGLLLFLELIAKDAESVLSTRLVEEVRQAVSAGRRLSMLVSSMLDVSKLENGAMVLKKEPCQVSREIMQILGDFRYLFRDRKVAVELPSGMISIQADKELFSRIIQNLLGNALKYTSEKGEVNIKATRQGDDLQISIADNGPGIPEDCREKIFEKYAQLELKEESKIQSSNGLGLTFCKMAVEAHGGKIGTQPRPGGGSIFWVKLPIGKDA